jgi:spore coat protein U-like protein
MTVAVRCVALLAALSLIPPTKALAATKVVEVSASVNKPLQFSRLQDLELGLIALNPGTWSNATVSVSQSGTLSCAAAKLVCSGVTQPGMYNVQGTNKMVVRISAPNVTLVNQQNSSQTLTLVLDSPGTITLTSSGVPGVNFGIGGSIALDSSVAPGLYAGTLNVTVDY